jgi:S-adenosylmethionine:tRNA ribosyltransferase-isomerase
MVLDPGGTQHRMFYELPELLEAGDVLVLNETRVIAARLSAVRAQSGGRVELLLLHPAGSIRYDPTAVRWIALVRPAKRLRTGSICAILSPRSGQARLGTARVVRELEDGVRELEFDVGSPFETFLARAGQLPLPPYIHNESHEAQERYQTVFARVPGSVAAPTASLHFTPRLLERLQERGIAIARLTLDVGLGTFRPVSARTVSEHRMHAEAYTLPAATVDAIERARREHRRIVAAGTTVVRALEGNALRFGRLAAGEHQTDCFIAPGFTFRIVDALITNFHLPRSTLLMLVSAFAGRQRMLDAYSEAVELRYRFFSFGDAMLIV